MGKLDNTSLSGMVNQNSAVYKARQALQSDSPPQTLPERKAQRVSLVPTKLEHKIRSKSVGNRQRAPGGKKSKSAKKSSLKKLPEMAGWHSRSTVDLGKQYAWEKNKNISLMINASNPELTSWSNSVSSKKQLTTAQKAAKFNDYMRVNRKPLPERDPHRRFSDPLLKLKREELARVEAQKQRLAEQRAAYKIKADKDRQKMLKRMRKRQAKEVAAEKERQREEALEQARKDAAQAHYKTGKPWRASMVGGSGPGNALYTAPSPTAVKKAKKKKKLKKDKITVLAPIVEPPVAAPVTAAVAVAVAVAVENTEEDEFEDDFADDFDVSMSADKDDQPPAVTVVAPVAEEATAAAVEMDMAEDEEDFEDDFEDDFDSPVKLPAPVKEAEEDTFEDDFDTSIAVEDKKEEQLVPAVVPVPVEEASTPIEEEKQEEEEVAVTAEAASTPPEEDTFDDDDFGLSDLDEATHAAEEAAHVVEDVVENITNLFDHLIHPNAAAAVNDKDAAEDAAPEAEKKEEVEEAEEDTFDDDFGLSDDEAVADEAPSPVVAVEDANPVVVAETTTETAPENHLMVKSISEPVRVFDDQELAVVSEAVSVQVAEMVQEAL